MAVKPGDVATDPTAYLAKQAAGKASASKRQFWVYNGDVRTGPFKNKAKAKALAATPNGGEMVSNDPSLQYPSYRQSPRTGKISQRLTLPGGKK